MKVKLETSTLIMHQKARKDGYEQIAAIFEETANNEKNMPNFGLNNCMEEKFLQLLQILEDAAAGENYEWTEMYKELAKLLVKKDFDKIAYLFESVGKIEAEHEKRYLTLLKKC